MPSPPLPAAIETMLPDFVASAALRVLNRLLDRDAQARERLQPFAGRIARFELAPLTLVLGIDVDGRFSAASGTPDVTIRVDAGALPSLLVDRNALLRKLHLSGDAEFAQTLAQVLQRLPPEPEEELARIVGDAAAVRIVGALRAVAGAVGDGAQRLARSTADYLVGESALLAGRREAEEFGRAASELRDAVERLEKRIAALESRGR